jgi:hypothetical protein
MSVALNAPAKFLLGRIVATPNMLASIPNLEILSALERHVRGDWGTLDAEGNCIYNIRHEENPLPIQALRDAIRDAREGRFIPDRENDELTCALGNADQAGI